MSPLRRKPPKVYVGRHRAGVQPRREPFEDTDAQARDDEWTDTLHRLNEDSDRERWLDGPPA